MFSSVFENIDILYIIIQYLSLSDQASLATVSSGFNYIFQNFFWGKNFKNLEICHHQCNRSYEDIIKASCISVKSSKIKHENLSKEQFKNFLKIIHASIKNLNIVFRESYQFDEFVNILNIMSIKFKDVQKLRITSALPFFIEYQYECDAILSFFPNLEYLELIGDVIIKSSGSCPNSLKSLKHSEQLSSDLYRDLIRIPDLKYLSHIRLYQFMIDISIYEHDNEKFFIEIEYNAFTQCEAIIFNHLIKHGKYKLVLHCCTGDDALRVLKTFIMYIKPMNIDSSEYFFICDGKYSKYLIYKYNILIYI